MECGIQTVPLQTSLTMLSGFTLPGVGEINAMKWLKKHPSARDLIAERMLNGLNRKNEYIQEF